MEQKRDNTSLPTEIVVSTDKDNSLAELTPAQLTQVMEYAKTIDISSPTQVMGYGIEARKKLDGYTNTVLEEVKNKDLGDTGDLITSVILKLKECDLEEPKGIRGIFGKGKRYVKTLKTKYESANTSIESIVSELDGRSLQLLKDIEMLENLYNQTDEYYTELTMYIAAGEQAIEMAKVKARELYDKAQASGSQMDAQRFNHFMSQINKFEKKIHDLKLTKSATSQLAPQIRMLQQTNDALSEKLQTTILTAIPIWKQQLVISLGIENALEAAALQKLVTDTTNQMLVSNAQRLHQASVKTATELERGIIDIETLKTVNSELIATLDDVVKIQRDGIQARLTATEEIKKIDGDLKAKLLTPANEDYIALPVEEAPVVTIEGPTTPTSEKPFTLKLKP